LDYSECRWIGYDTLHIEFEAPFPYFYAARQIAKHASKQAIPVKKILRNGLTYDFKRTGGNSAPVLYAYFNSLVNIYVLFPPTLLV